MPGRGSDSDPGGTPWLTRAVAGDYLERRESKQEGSTQDREGYVLQLWKPCYGGNGSSNSQFFVLRENCDSPLELVALSAKGVFNEIRRRKRYSHFIGEKYRLIQNAWLLSQKENR